jgi:hypothetical protein
VTKDRRVVPEFVGAAYIAQLLGISENGLHDLVRDGRITKISTGKYDPIVAVRQYREYKMGVGARSEVEQQRAVKLKRENTVAMRELIPMEDARQVIFEMSATFNQGMDALPSRIAVRGEMKSKAELTEIVRAEVSKYVAAVIQVGESFIATGPASGMSS